MKSNNKSMEDFVRDSLKDQEYPYDNSQWIKIEKKLPSTFGETNYSKPILSTIVAITAITASIIAYLYFNPKPSISNNINLNRNTQIAENSTFINTNTIKNQPIIEPSNFQTNNEEKNLNLPEYISTYNTKIDSDKTILNTFEEVVAVSYSDPTELETLRQVPQQYDEYQNLPDPSFDLAKNEGCAPFSVSVVPSIISDSLLYLWNFGTNSSTGETNAQYTYEKPGVYEITLLVKNKFDAKLQAKLSKTIIVKQPVIAKFEYANLENFQCEFNNLSLNAENYSWNFGDSKISSDKNPKHTYDKNGEYAVQLLALNNNGCKDVAEVLVRINTEATIFIPSAFIPNGDGNNEQFGPVGNDLIDDGYSLIIYDRSGSLIFESHTLSHKWDGINTKTNKYAGEGVYVYKVIVKTSAGKTIEKTGAVAIIK